MAEKQLSDGGPDGTVLGQGTTDLVGFHGTTGTAQTSLTTLATAATVATAVASVQEIIALLQAKGLAG
jgi:hypothetical protein